MGRTRHASSRACPHLPPTPQHMQPRVDFFSLCWNGCQMIRARLTCARVLSSSSLVSSQSLSLSHSPSHLLSFVAVRTLQDRIFSPWEESTCSPPSNSHFHLTKEANFMMLLGKAFKMNGRAVVITWSINGVLMSLTSLLDDLYRPFICVHAFYSFIINGLKQRIEQAFFR